jgi:hypothetical protein
MEGETGETAEMEASGVGEEWGGGADYPVQLYHRFQGGVASAPHVGRDAHDWLTLDLPAAQAHVPRRLYARGPRPRGAGRGRRWLAPECETAC